jgi:hypothetical protein
MEFAGRRGLLPNIATEHTKNFHPQFSVFSQSFAAISIASDANFRRNGA